MTVGARLRSKAASSLPRRGLRGRGRAEGDEEATAILEHLELGDEVTDSAASAERPGTRSARRVHLAVLPERYEPLEEPAQGDKPKRRYRQKLKKYGKVGAPVAHCPGSHPLTVLGFSGLPLRPPSGPTPTFSPAFIIKTPQTVPSVTWEVRKK